MNFLSTIDNQGNERRNSINKFLQEKTKIIINKQTIEKKYHWLKFQPMKNYLMNSIIEKNLFLFKKDFFNQIK